MSALSDTTASSQRCARFTPCPFYLYQVGALCSLLPEMDTHWSPVRCETDINDLLRNIQLVMVVIGCRQWQWACLWYPSQTPRRSIRSALALTQRSVCICSHAHGAGKHEWHIADRGYLLGVCLTFEGVGVFCKIWVVVIIVWIFFFFFLTELFEKPHFSSVPEKANVNVFY